MWSKHLLDTLYIHTLSYTKKIKQIIDHYMSMYVIQYQRMHSYKNIRKQVLSQTQNKVKENKTFSSNMQWEVFFAWSHNENTSFNNIESPCTEN